jgi:hypothetical protein
MVVPHPQLRMILVLVELMVSKLGLESLERGGLSNWVEARYQWLTSVILATWEAEIRRIVVQDHPRQMI